VNHCGSRIRVERRRLQLSLAYMRIKDAKVRKRVLDLVKSLAEDGSAKD